MELTFFDMALRLISACICGGIIGVNRGLKNRPAGIRTHMIICIGSALTMILGTYFSVMLVHWDMVTVTADASRIGAQVISGIGFIGVGTIMVTGKQKITGLTTAAGLWASACMGIAIGVGFYLAAVIGCVFIFITVVFFSRIEHAMFAKSRNINLYVEFEHIDCVSLIIGALNQKNITVRDVDISKASEEEPSDRAVFSLRLPKKMGHDEVITAVAEQYKVRSVEEL